jgi:hypothetical protein
MNVTQRQQHYEALGFTVGIANSGAFRLTCNACETMTINGVPTHETGCPNAKHECAGCSNIVPIRVKYCDDCR